MSENDHDLISTRPYLVRAIREWTIDNGLTPQLLVNAQAEGVEVPQEFIEEGRIVLNVHPKAVDAMHLGNDFISFLARFHGVSRQVTVPLSAVMGIFARENNQGMFFKEERSAPSGKQTQDDPPLRGKPQLKLVE